MNTLQEKFEKEIKQQLQKDLGKRSILAVPRLEKIVVSTGVGKLKESKEQIDKVAVEFTRIIGQKPKLNIAVTSVSAFKLRAGQPVGLTATLRGGRMYDFLSKLVNVSLPRVRDFRGLSLKAFDGNGNYCVGIKEYSIFPEVKYEDISNIFGFQINFKTTAKNDEDAKALLTALGLPFEKHK